MRKLSNNIIDKGGIVDISLDFSTKPFEIGESKMLQTNKESPVVINKGV